MKNKTTKKKKDNGELFFSKRLKEIMKDMSITAYRLSEDSKINYDALAGILKGKRYPSFSTLIKIYRHFPNVSLYWLVLGEGPKYK